MRRTNTFKVAVSSRCARGAGLAGALVGLAGCSGSVGEPAEATEATSSALLDETRATAEADYGKPDDYRITATTGSTGALEISDFFIGGAFFTSDLILRAKGHPECVTHIQSAAEPLAEAGTLVVSSDRVGAPGGPQVPFVIDPDPFNHDYFAFPDQPLFNLPDSIRVRLTLAGAPGLPPIRSQTLRSPGFATINVTAPPIPDSGVLAVSSTAALELAWEVPEMIRGEARHRQHVSVRIFVLGPVSWGSVYCSWPVTAGHGNVPALLLHALRSQLGGTGAVDGNIDVYAGEFTEIETAKSSYVVFTTTDNGTTLPRSTSVTFE